MNKLKKNKALYRSISVRQFVLVVVSLMLTTSLFAQKRSITGTVTDDAGETLVGVNIIVKGTTVGTTTDIDGNFSIQVPDNSAVLEAIYIVSLQKEIAVGSTISPCERRMTSSSPWEYSNISSRLCFFLTTSSQAISMSSK